jgi:hypothetical protein
MFLFTNLIPPLENILSHSKLGVFTTITIGVGIAIVRGGTISIVASTPLFS